MNNKEAKIRYIFKSLGRDYTLTVPHWDTVEQAVALIETERVKVEKQGQLNKIKAFVKKEMAQGASQFIRLDNREFLELYLQRCQDTLVIQFFFASKKDSISMKLVRIGNDLQERERELRLMVNELKDQACQLYAIEIINKLSSSRSSIEVEHLVDVHLMISDPLVTVGEDSVRPIYHDEVNVSAHLQRLKRASTSYSNLTIKAKVSWATRMNFVNIFSDEAYEGKKIKIVQFMTEVRRINGKLMIAFQRRLGERIWEPAEEMLSYYKVDLLIVVGVGANLLAEIDYPKPLILITSISLEDKKSATHSKNILDLYNAYNDTFAQTFLESFFQNLFKRVEIGESVELAKKESSKFVEKYIWCCCMHQHAPQCKWQQIVDKIGHLQAHRLFKHTFQDYKKDNFYTCTLQIQSLLLGSEQTCATGSICCYQKLGESKVGLHKQVDKILFWNEQCSSVLYESLDEDGKLNKFECEEYDKPSGRKHPLSTYNLLQALAQDKKVLIVKSHSISDAKRHLTWAKEYLQARDNEAYFCQLAVSNESEAKNYLKEVLKKLKSRSKIGRNTTLRVNIFVQIVHNVEKTDKTYYKIFNEYPTELLSLAQVVGLQIGRVKIVLLTSNPNFDVLYPLFKVQESHQSEIYHDVLCKYSYDYVRGNLGAIGWQIKRQKMVEEDIQKICDDMLFERYNQYLFLGFISLFSEDGFYLTKYGRIITENLFGQEVLEKTANHTFPIEMIALSDCVYLKLSKSYIAHFTRSQNGHRRDFQMKRLEYYYILFRTYTELDANQARFAVKREGLFAIDILLEDKQYNGRVESCKKSIREAGGPESLYDNTHFRHLYHLSQTEKIINSFAKRKKNQYVNSSKSFIRQVEPYICTYLFWNIIHLAWRIASTSIHQFPEKVNNLQSTLLLFLIRVEVTLPFAEVGRLQLYSMLGKFAPKPQEPIKGSKEMGKLLSLIRTYSIQQHNLAEMELSWGQTTKVKELICSCLNIAQRIIELLAHRKEGSELSKEFEQHKMFSRFDVVEWYRQILKLTQKKIIFYFQLNKMLKDMQPKSSWKEKEKEFNNQFKLSDLYNEFTTVIAKLPDADTRKKQRILIHHYLKIMLNDQEPSSEIIQDVKGKLAPQFLPLFNHLCQKIEQKTLFNQKGLIICARQRTFLFEGHPYLMSRKKNLTMLYLKQTLHKMSLKISYFTLNSNTLSNLQSNQSNNKCEVQFLILTIDSLNEKQLLIGQDYGINAELMDVSKFASQIKSCRISFLIICGKNSTLMCEQLYSLIKDYEYSPNIIAIQNNKYSLCDQPYNNYQSQIEGKAWGFICNQVNQIAFDLLAIAIIANINNKLVHRAWTFSEKDVKERVDKSIDMVKSILNKHFECTDQVLSLISFRVWVNHKKIDRVANGTLQDLTAKFYTSQHNLNDQDFYQNIGRCHEVNKIIESIVKEGKRCIQIVGTTNTGKSTLLQQTCWISQTKSLFKFGVFKFNLAEGKDTDLMSFEAFIKDRKFKNSEHFKGNQTSVLIALDNVDEHFLQAHKQILWSLKGKSVTVIFTTNKTEVGQSLKAILDCKTNTINLNSIGFNEVYGVLMSYIRMYRSGQSHRFSRGIVEEYQKKVNSIMRLVEFTEEENRLSRALQLLKEISPKKEEERIILSLEFYKKNFEGLVKLIQNVKELRVKIV